MKMNNQKLDRAPVSYKVHYRAQAIINSPKFEEFRRAFSLYFKERDLPIPTEGFPKVNNYHDWEKKVYERELGETHYSLIHQFLLSVGIIDKSDELEDLEPYFIFELCFHQTPFPVERESLSWDYIYNKETKQRELIVKVPTITREADWNKFWKILKPALQGLPGYREKTVPWSGFYRDIELYYLFLKVNQDINNQTLNVLKNSNKITKKMNSPMSIMKEYDQYEEIKSKYAGEGTLSNFTDERLYRIINRCKSIFSDLTLLN